MRATWLYAFASVFLLATDCPPVTASRYAVIPRQNDRSSQATTSTAVALPSATSQASAQSSSAPATTSSISVSASDKATSGAAQGTSNTSSASATASGSPTSASVVLGPTGTPIANTTLNGTTTYAPTIEGLPIRPKITPALSVAGALLILTGTFYTLVGIKTKWLHIFLSTAYLFSLAVTVLIIYVMHPPISNAIQGAYFAAACVTGLVFGAVAVVFSDVTEGLGCFLGGFCLAMWFLVLKSGGIITSTAGKAIFIACFTVGTFGLYISHHTRPYGLIGSTSFAGATVVVLGIDCFSRAGLKEFWLYVWNLNVDLFPLHYDGPYPMTRGIRVEIACTILIFLLGMMSQMKVWKIVKRRRQERAADQLCKKQERDQAEEDLGRELEAGNVRERGIWEAVYGTKKKAKLSQVDSGIGTDEPSSTRKGSMSEAGGMEMQKPKGSANGTKERGRVMVHVAQDDDVDEILSASGQHPVELMPRTSISPSLQESHVEQARKAISDTASTKSAGKGSRTVIDPSLTLKPKFVPLPFKVPSERESDDDEASSVATFAASENLPDRSPQRRPKSSLMKRLSKRPEQDPTTSDRALMIPHIEDDRAFSMAATFDGVSDCGDPESTAHTRDGSPASRSVEAGGLADPTSSHAPQEFDPAATSEQPHNLGANDLTVDAPKTMPDYVDPLSGGSISGFNAAQGNDVQTGTKQPAMTRSRATSQTSEHQAARANLTGNLPEGASKVVMAYRTNEWAKHLDRADLPEVDEIKVNKSQVTLSTAPIEHPAPVDVRALQQTPLTAEPAPLKIKTSGDRSSLPSMNRLTSPQSANPYANHQSPQQSRSSLAKTSSQESLSSSHSKGELSRPSLPKTRSSQTSLAPARGYRSSSTPMLNTGLAESPIEEGVEASFPNRFTPSPSHLMSQRDTLIRNKPSSTSLLRHTSSPLSPTTSSLYLNRQTSSSSTNTVTLPLNLSIDNVPLSHRKFLLQQQTPTAQHHQSYTSPSQPKRCPSQQSLPQHNASQAPLAQRDSAVSAWRASLAPSSTAVYQHQEIENRRRELLAEKRRESNSNTQAQIAQGRRESVLDRGMRRGSMLDAHREAMRKMQGEANVRLSGGKVE